MRFNVNDETEAAMERLAEGPSDGKEKQVQRHWGGDELGGTERDGQHSSP